jgi:hypothetical protein
MKRFASLLWRAAVAALLLTSVVGGTARADDGNGLPNVGTTILPEDPGIEPLISLPEDPGIEPIVLPEDPGIE